MAREESHVAKRPSFRTKGKKGDLRRQTWMDCTNDLINICRVNMSMIGELSNG